MVGRQFNDEQLVVAHNVKKIIQREFDLLKKEVSLLSKEIPQGPFNPQKLRADIQKSFSRVLASGVRKIEINAYPEQEVRISMNTEKMAQMNISIDHILNAVKSNNANIPGGAVKLGDKSFGIKTSGSYKNLDEIRNTVVNSYQG